MVNIKQRILTITMTALLLAPWQLYAQVYAEVSKNSVVEDELFQLHIVSDQKAQASDLDLSALDKDFYVGQPSFSNSINIINGLRSNKSEWTVNLAPQKTGVLTIPSFTVAGESTRSIALQVIADKDKPSSNEIFQVETDLKSRTLYPDQSTLMHVKLYIKIDTRRLRDPKITPPSAAGLELEAASDPDQHNEVINGRPVTVLEQSFRITATKPGDFSVTEPQINATAYFSNRYGQTLVRAVSSEAKSYPITVKEKPSGIKGQWLPADSLTLSQTWQNELGEPIEGNEKVKVGDSISRTITITATGIAQSRLPIPNPTYPANVRVYSEKPQYHTLDGQVSLSVKQVIIPNKAGEITLPPYTLDWWDSQQNRQRRALIPSLDLDVAPNKSSTQALTVANAPLTPATPVSAEPKVIVKSESTIWPWLTALFATLWLITTAILLLKIRKDREPPEEQTPLAGSLKDEDKLKQAIASQDGFTVNQIITQWLSDNNVDNAISEPLVREKSALLESWYRPQTDSPNDGKALLSAWKQAQKEVNKTQKSEVKLAKL